MSGSQLSSSLDNKLLLHKMSLKETTQNNATRNLSSTELVN